MDGEKGSDMAYKQIVVHLDNTGRSETRLDVAVELATRFGARLSGLFAECDPYLANLASRRPSAIYSDVVRKSEAIFRSITEQRNIVADWQAVTVRRDSALADAIVASSRLADISVLGQFQHGITDSGIPQDLVERVVARSGRPLLVIPFAGEYSYVGRRVMVAWNGGREASRALNDALPFLREADEVFITSISSLAGGTTRRKDICAGVAHYLRAHDIEAKTETLVAEKGWTMDTLLSHVVDHGADLLVLGADGSYGAPDRPQGGGTQYILSQLTVPVLMSY